MSPTLKELALRYLREKLESGAIKPGEKLSDLVLSREIGISRTPIREAINQLASEGLVEMAPHEGAYVKMPSPREFKELCEIREVLEGYAAAKIAVSSPSKSDLMPLTKYHDEIVALLEKLRKERRKVLTEAEARRELELDFSFHMAIIRMADNSRLEKIVRDFRIMGRIFDSIATSMTVEILEATCEWHAGILSALQKHDPERAREKMSFHIRRSFELHMERMNEKESSSSPKMKKVPEALRRFVKEQS